MNTTDLLSRFTNPADPRPFIQRPVLWGGYLWATNSHMAVRIPADGEESALYGSTQSAVVSMLNLFSGIPWIRGNFFPITDERIDNPCGNCVGTGRIAVERDEKCGECDGHGHFHHGQHTYICRECHGDGTVGMATGEMVDCPHCNGDGVRHYAKIGNLYFNAAYIDTIKSLPSVVMWTPNATHGAAGFRFDGGEGIIMSLWGI